MGVISPFFPVSGKWKPVPPLLSISFVPRVPCAYLCLISGGSGNAYILLGGQSTNNGDEADVTRMVFYWIFK